mgnify:FL=1
MYNIDFGSLTTVSISTVWRSVCTKLATHVVNIHFDSKAMKDLKCPVICSESLMHVQ